MVDQSQKAGLSLEEVCRQIFAEQSAWRKVLIGGLLCLSLIGIPVAFGFFWRYMAKVRASGDFSLPEWTDPLTLVIPGLKAMAVCFVWFGVPSLVALGLQSLFFAIFAPLGFLWILVTVIVFWVCSCLAVSALWLYQREPEWATLLEWEKILAPFRKTWSSLILPGVAFVGIVSLISPILPLLPFVFFGGFLPFMAYTLQVYVFSRKGI